MTEFIQSIFNNIDPALAYFVLFVSAFVENVFPPIPGDTVTVLGAYLVSQGHLGFWGVYLSTSTGSLCGFATMYYLGYRYGRAFFYQGKRVRYFGESRLQKAEKWFSHWGYWVILANRFLSGTRSVISVFAGLFHLRFWYVHLLAFISILVWNGLLISAGLLVGKNWQKVTEFIRHYNEVVLILIILFIIFLVYKKRHKKRITADQKSVQ